MPGARRTGGAVDSAAVGIAGAVLANRWSDGATATGTAVEVEARKQADRRIVSSEASRAAFAAGVADRRYG